MVTFLGYMIFVALMAATAFAMGFSMPAGEAAYRTLAEKIKEKKLRKKAQLQPVPV